MIAVLLVSLIVTLVIIPPLFVFVTRRKSVLKSAKIRTSIIEKLYLKILKKILESSLISKLIIISVIAMLLTSGYLLKEKINKELIATPLTDIISLNIKYQQTAKTPEDSEKIVTYYEKQLEQKTLKQHINKCYSFINMSRSNISCLIKDPKQGQEIKKLFEDTLKNQKDSELTVHIWNPTSLKIPESALVDGRIIKNQSTKEDIRSFLEAYYELAKDTKQISTTRIEPNFKKQPTFYLIPKEDISFGLGEQYEQLEKTWDLVGQQLKESYLDPVSFSGKIYQVKMTYDQNSANSIEDILNLNLPWKDNFIPLKNIVSTEKAQVWQNIYTLNGVENFHFKSYLKDSYKEEKAQVKRSFLDKINNLANKHSIKLSFTNPEKEINDNLISLTKALLISFIFLLILLSYQFGPGLYPLLILLPIPLGLIGTSFALYVFSSSLSLSSIMGLILLSGTAVNNSIIFVDFFLNRRKTLPKELIKDAILETARLRIKPILMTTITTLVGMLPLALAIGKGGEVIQPLGITICGGLAVSTVLTLIILPMLLCWSGQASQKPPSKLSAAMVVLLLLPALLFSSSLEASTVDLNTAKQQAVMSREEIAKSYINEQKAVLKKEEKKTLILFQKLILALNI